MSTTQQLSRPRRSGGRPNKGIRRSLYVRVAASLWDDFVGEAAISGIYQPDLMKDILLGRYRTAGQCPQLQRRPERNDRVVLEVKVPLDLWLSFTDEAATRGVSKSDHMEDILTARYADRAEREVMSRKSA